MLGPDVGLVENISLILIGGHKENINMISIFKRGKVVGRSKNLRGISSRHRKHPVTKSTLKKTKGGGAKLKVKFFDKSHAEADFASHTVAKKWLATKRKRSGWA